MLQTHQLFLARIPLLHCRQRYLRGLGGAFLLCHPMHGRKPFHTVWRLKVLNQALQTLQAVSSLHPNARGDGGNGIIALRLPAEGDSQPNHLSPT